MSEADSILPPEVGPRPPVQIVGKLWVNGRLVGAGVDVELEVSPDGWQVSGRLAAFNPFTRVYGLSLQLADGRALHGPARLCSAEGGVVVFRGIDPRLGAAWSDCE